MDESERNIALKSAEEEELCVKLCNEFSEDCRENERLVKFMALTCLRFRRYKYDAAKSRLRNYLKWRRIMFGDLTDQSIAKSPKLREQIESSFTFIAPERLSSGSGVLYITMKHHKPSEFSAEDTIRCWHFLVLDAISRDPSLASAGFTLVNNMLDCTFSNLDFRFPPLMASAVLEALPIRVCKIVVLNPPLLIRFTIPMVKSILPAKLSCRLNVVMLRNELHKQLGCAAEMVPAHLGSCMMTSQQWAQQLTVAEVAV